MSDTPRPAADQPVTFDEASAALSESVVGRTLERLLGTIGRAARDSRLAALFRDLRAATADEEQALHIGGIVLVVAMAVHVLLLRWAQPYPFPGYSQYWLPLTLLIFGIAMIAGRRLLLAAWRERRTKRQ